MLWEGRPLRDIRDADARRLVESGLEEHLQLEYKSALYEDNDRGRREFLLDICMFANSSGGVLLIGVPEQRDEHGQPTGAPNPAAPFGLELPNPELVLGAYDARVTEAIEERLPLEMASIDVGQGRRLVAIRVPDSVRKPHSVRYQGHVYFPGRRERQRYPLSVREIKELTMRTASRLQQSEEMLRSAFAQVAVAPDLPYLIIGMIRSSLKIFSWICEMRTSVWLWEGSVGSARLSLVTCPTGSRASNVARIVSNTRCNSGAIACSGSASNCP